VFNKQIVSLGLPFYGKFDGEWVTQNLLWVSSLSKNHEIRDIIAVGNMTADHNRNTIVSEFLKSDAEWLFWIDSDTLVPVGAFERMVAQGKTMVSGLYYGKNPPHPPIAYMAYNGAFTPLDKMIKWEKGEIVKVDAVGFGCMLTHRSVFTDILANYEVYQMPSGGIRPIHKSDILGDVETTEGVRHHEHDGKVYKGQWRIRLKKPSLADLKFPFFMVDHQMTEDMFFFPMAARCGHVPYLDTSVECGHLRLDPYTGAKYREEFGH
jgi:hypothetical protein